MSSWLCPGERMYVRSGSTPMVFVAGFLVTSCSVLSRAQQPVSKADDAMSPAIPDAPVPQIEVALAADPQTVDPQSGPAQNTQPPATGTAPAASSGAAQSSSCSQNSAQQPDTQETKHQKAEQEVKEQEHQRIAGIIPEFNVSYRSNAVPLTPAEKFKLEFRAATDPYTFTIATIVAGLGEAEDSDAGLGWGPGGFAKRAAAAYGDNVTGNTLGNAVLPSILHQDQRYFRLGHGSVRRRFFYAVATAFISKHDTTGKWEPNYPNVLGNMIAGEISNFYYPDGSKSNVGQTIDNRPDCHLRGYVWLNSRGVLAGYFAETLSQRSDPWSRCTGSGSRCKAEKAAGGGPEASILRIGSNFRFGPAGAWPCAAIFQQQWVGIAESDGAKGAGKFDRPANQAHPRHHPQLSCRQRRRKAAA
jgi:hypothetical protein